ncbi:MAG: hypothetical protein GX496_12655, partial [Firmicutes bacterium]|nr:hypothetical protein [Bacillota bacterium]
MARRGATARALALATTAALVLVAGVGVSPGVRAAEPVKERQVVYGITPWTGKEYGGTFAPAQV